MNTEDSDILLLSHTVFFYYKVGKYAVSDAAMLSFQTVNVVHEGYSKQSRTVIKMPLMRDLLPLS